MASGSWMSQAAKSEEEETKKRVPSNDETVSRRIRQVVRNTYGLMDTKK